MEKVSRQEITEAYTNGTSHTMRVQGILRGGVKWNGHFWFSASVAAGEFKVRLEA